MLGDSVKRRQPPARRRVRKKAGGAAGFVGRWKMWVAVLAVLSLPFVLGYGVAVRVLFPPPPVVAQGISVPRLTGQTLQAAQRSVLDAGLGVVEASELPSLTAPVGTVIAQSPLPGQQLRASAPVRVAVSSGPPRVFVPDVIGFPVERAASLLVRLGFRVQRFDSVATADAGTVIDINPGPRSQITLPAGVAITVSLGPPPDTVAVDTLTTTDSVRVSGRTGWSVGSETPIFTWVQQVTASDGSRADGSN